MSNASIIYSPLSSYINACTYSHSTSLEHCLYVNYYMPMNDSDNCCYVCSTCTRQQLYGIVSNVAQQYYLLNEK